MRLVTTGQHLGMLDRTSYRLHGTLLSLGNDAASRRSLNYPSCNAVAWSTNFVIFYN